MSDTQDEAERLACKYSTEVIMNNPSLKFDGASVKTGYRAGYRAGQSSKEPEIAELKKRHAHLASGCDEMMTVQAALREENAKLKEWQQEDKDNDKLFCKWRDDLEHENSKLETENERLKESLSAVTVIQQRDAAIKELAASRAEVERLKADFNSAAEAAMIHGTNHDNLSDIYLVLRKQLAAEKQKAQKLVEALEIFLDDLSSGPKLSKVTESLRDYSTDSGDGEG